jgi:hypothetical protein
MQSAAIVDVFDEGADRVACVGGIEPLLFTMGVGRPKAVKIGPTDWRRCRFDPTSLAQDRVLVHCSLQRPGNPSPVRASALK